MYPNLKLQIWKAGIHQNQLARVIGVDETLLSRIINGYREPSPELRARIAEFFHIDEEWLFDRELQPSRRRVEQEM